MPSLGTRSDPNRGSSQPMNGLKDMAEKPLILRTYRAHVNHTDPEKLNYLERGQA